MSASIKELSALPTELWRSIFRWCTAGSGHPFSTGHSSSFGWPHHPTFDAFFFRSFATKCTLVLVSHRFCEIASEFLYETLHFRRAEQAILLAELCRTNRKIAGYMRTRTRTLYITPVSKLVTTKRQLEELGLFLRSSYEIAQTCGQLQTVLVQVDTTTVFHEPTYRPWVELLSVLPSELRHLSVENFLLGPVAWKPQLFSTWNTSSNLRTLRLDAVHPPFEHYFPHLTDLWLYSWPTASKWGMPSLENLYIEYFPENGTTSSFWTMVRPRLKLLYFGGDTDFGLYYPDLPQRLQEYVPHLQELQYHYSGDLDIPWNPEQLSRRLERVKIKCEYAEGSDTGSPSTAQDVLFPHPATKFGTLRDLLIELCPSASHRCGRIERHLDKYSSHPANLFMYLPKRAVEVLHLEAQSPLMVSRPTTVAEDLPPGS